MANTTDILISGLSEPEAMQYISDTTGLELPLISDGEVAGGQKVLTMESHGACYRCLGEEKISEIIEAFRAAPFLFPELASLTISDDNEVFNGVITRCRPEGILAAAA